VGHRGVVIEAPDDCVSRHVHPRAVRARGDVAGYVIAVARAVVPGHPDLPPRGGVVGDRCIVAVARLGSVAGPGHVDARAVRTDGHGVRKIKTTPRPVVEGTPTRTRRWCGPSRAGHENGSAHE